MNLDTPDRRDIEESPFTGYCDLKIRPVLISPMCLSIFCLRAWGIPTV